MAEILRGSWPAPPLAGFGSGMPFLTIFAPRSRFFCAETGISITETVNTMTEIGISVTETGIIAKKTGISMMEIGISATMMGISMNGTGIDVTKTAI